MVHVPQPLASARYVDQLMVFHGHFHTYTQLRQARQCEKDSEELVAVRH